MRVGRMTTPSPSPPSRAFIIITAALEELGFHEDGEEENGFHFYTTYRNQQRVMLDDSADVSLEKHVETVFQQEPTLDAAALHSAIAQVQNKFGGG